MNWRVAKSLGNTPTEGLLGEINAFAKNRSRSSDGSIGDAAHASRNSDHNPWVKDRKGQPVVTARDFTHDPARGFDSYVFARSLAKSGDKRLKYIISNGQIWNASQGWRRYTGSNPHDHHAHVSVSYLEHLYDDISDWVWEAGMVPMPGDRPVLPQITDPVLRRGSKGSDVARLQALLGVKVDGDFGPATERAVKAFQAARGLGADGVVGLYTWRALKAAPKVVPTAEASPRVIIPASVFDRVIEYVIDDEGDELNLSPNEPGGASKYGVSLDTLSKYLGRKASLSELRNLSPETAKQIYRRLYWDAIGLDKLAPGLNYAAFDFGVNSGVATVDGKGGMDDYLNQALLEPTVTLQIDRLCDLRLERMRANPDWPKYSRGWTARVSRVRARAHALSGVAPMKLAA